ncbi:hypothetical protein CCU68_19815 [Pseudomonas gingeri NCPPB 3146 = LMG 5327]|uniref:DUF1534 domain-containing protein n=1 Tax=Pseudomonas gingeri NCPPB 3146 = LMG 5327 TaxID=707248 RepID=A0ABX4Y0E3_9PSED|nr:hypothetical protein CCU68_19815 [Pseudomonas gingeri NCPPB 3146 = LMG 5327]
MIVPTLRRGNASRDAPRPLCDAERHGLHAHAERGNDRWSPPAQGFSEALIQFARSLTSGPLMVCPTPG